MKDFVVAFCRLAQKNTQLVVDEQSKDYWRWRDTVLHTEEILIEAICFDLHLESPSRHLANLLLALNITDANIKTAANAFLRDSNLTTACLLSSPKAIAAAALYIGARHCDIAINNTTGQQWWTQFGVSNSELEKACGSVLTIQEKALLHANGGGGNTPNSPPITLPG
jgi:protein BUR2